MSAQVKPKTAPPVRLAQAASPTIGVGGDPNSAAPPAATFPTGNILPGANSIGDGGFMAPDATNGGFMAPDSGAFVPTAPLPPMGGMRGRQVVPRVPRLPTGVGENNIFTSPLAPGMSVNSSTADKVKAYNGLGEVRLRQGRFAEALELFTQALQLDPNDPIGRIGAARSLRGQSNFTGALSEIDPRGSGRAD